MNKNYPLTRPDGSTFFPHMPTWFDYERAGQQFEVAESIATEIHKGCGVVLFQAPAGRGKTAVTELVRQILTPPEDHAIRRMIRMLYVAPTIRLQNQFLRAFREAMLAMGKGNFPHGMDVNRILFPEQTCRDCREKDLCRKDGSCDYKEARDEWSRASLGVVNLAYYLAVANHLGSISCERGGQTDGDGCGAWTPVFAKKWRENQPVFIGDNDDLLRMVYKNPECDYCQSHKGPFMVLRRGESEVTCCCRGCINTLNFEWPEGWMEWFWGSGAGWNGGASGFGDRGYLTVFDECDLVEAAIPNLFKVEVNMGWLAEVCRIAQQKPPEPPVRRKDELWYGWTQNVLEVALDALDVLQEESKADRSGKNIDRDRKISRMENFVSGLKGVEESWCYQADREIAETKTGKQMRIGGVSKVTLIPVNGAEIGDRCLWRFAGRTIAMSATISDFDNFVNESGLRKMGTKFGVVEVGSDWNKWRGVIFRVNLDIVKRSGKRESWASQPCWKSLIEWLEYIIFTYPDERTLIHTATYELAEDLNNFWRNNQSLRGRLFPHLRSMTKEEQEHQIEGYLKTEGGVIFSPILSRGFDLPGPKLRNNVIPKMFYPNLDTEQVARRMRMPGGENWYKTCTVRELIQALARGQRGPLDWCRNWILDGIQFQKLLDHWNKKIFPRHILMSIRKPMDFAIPAEFDFGRIEREEREIARETEELLKGLGIVRS